MRAALARGWRPVCGLALTWVLVGCAQLPAPGEASSWAGTLGPQAGPDVSAPAAPPVELPAHQEFRTDLDTSPAPALEGVSLATGAPEPKDLWQRIRLGLTMADLDDEVVRQKEQFYARRPEYLTRMAERGRRYLFHVVEELERRGMPAELALLPFVESAFNPQAQSSAKAMGMWQFIPATGKDFDLKQNIFRDDRRDVLASTRAALDFLQRLHDQFGDWHLALAAYNWGPGNVRKALARNEKEGLGLSYPELRMPAETRQYVPKLQALKNILLEPGRFGVALPDLPNHPYFDTVPVDRDMDVTVATRLARISHDEFLRLNPQLNKPVILAAGTEQLLLPFDNAEIFRQSLMRHEGPLASWTAWVVPKTMRPAEAAKQLGMPESQLREVNRLPAKMLVKAGSTLLVPRAAHSDRDVPEHLADNAALLLEPERVAATGRQVRVGKGGESVAALARRHGLKPEQLARWNKTSVNGRFAGGTVVRLSPAPAGGTQLAKAGTGKTSASGSNRKGSSAKAGTKLAAKNSNRPARQASERVAQR
ncbi:transglycosylase SLT domain-containing protein [Ideonella sp. TBM-1]|uniref:Transglycosylase SLT domain-containing protein n=2 Tax=Ideonella livida TaxID=2707176 RepID=A0A7C9TIS4_9BURK|nr:transglycosylase SLT domain-containing protein [Ideonella livida]